MSLASQSFQHKNRMPLKNWEMTLCFDDKEERAEFVKKLVALSVSVDFSCYTSKVDDADCFFVTIDKCSWLSNMQSVVRLLEELGYD